MHNLYARFMLFLIRPALERWAAPQRVAEARARSDLAKTLSRMNKYQPPISVWTPQDRQG